MAGLCGQISPLPSFGAAVPQTPLLHGHGWRNSGNPWKGSPLPCCRRNFFTGAYETHRGGAALYSAGRNVLTGPP